MPSSIDPHTSIVRTDGHLTAALGGGETALLGADLEHYFGLDPVGSRVWELAAEPVSVRELCDRLTSEFEVERATCERQTIGFLRQLLANGLVRVVDRSTGA